MTNKKLRHSGRDCRNPECRDSSKLAFPGTGYPLAGEYDHIDYSKALDVEEEPVNAYIRVSLTCVQRADASHLRQIILDGLNKSEAAP